jgi:hypothetical protein
MSKKVKSTREEQKAGLSKKTLIRAVDKGSRNLVKTAVSLRGYSVVVKNGWVVQINESGRVLKKIAPVVSVTPSKKRLFD